MKKIQYFVAVSVICLVGSPLPEVDFKAYYTRIDSGQEFEHYSRTGPYADIVVNLSDGKFVSWRGSSYLSYWETDKGRCYVDELIRRSGDGPAERPDWVNTYSRVMIVESIPEKAVICWRYPRQCDSQGWFAAA